MIRRRQIHVNNVGRVEAESLFHFQAVVGIGKAERGRSIHRARGGWYIQRLRQLVAQICVVGPQRERIPGLGRGLRVDQVQRLAGIVFVFLQNPGGDLAAAIGKRNPVQLVLDHSGRFIVATTACPDGVAESGVAATAAAAAGVNVDGFGCRTGRYLGRGLRLASFS